MVTNDNVKYTFGPLIDDVLSLWCLLLFLVAVAIGGLILLTIEFWRGLNQLSTKTAHMPMLNG